MRRFFTEPENISDNTAHIYEDASHIKKVLRMNIDDKILIFDGSGTEYTATLTEISDKCCTAEILSSETSKQEPNIKVSIFQALPKSGKMEDIIQKSVELGVHSVIPVATDRCVTKLDGGKREAEKIKRWNKVSVSAAKQCGRGILPQVCSPVSFKNAVSDMRENFDLALMPYEMLGHNGVANIHDILSDFKKNYKNVKNNIKIAVLIGPEGGFSDSEAEYTKESNIFQIGLGSRILRTETVSSAILSMLMYEFEEI